MHPADDYVAEFVAGISRLKIVKASAVMTPLAAFEAEHGALPGDALAFDKSTSLGTLIDASLETENPIAIVDETHQRVGAITRTDLLRIVSEGQEAA